MSAAPDSMSAYDAQHAAHGDRIDLEPARQADRDAAILSP